MDPSGLIKRIASGVPDRNSNLTYWAELAGAATLGAPHIGIISRLLEPAAFWLPPGIIVPTEIGLGVAAVTMSSMILAKLAVRNKWAIANESTWKLQKRLEITLGGMTFTEKDMFTNIIAFGGIGSGKTTCVVYPILDRVTGLYNDEDPRSDTAKWGGFVLDVKGDFHETVIFVMEKHGRDVLEDLVVIRPDNDYFILELEDIPTGNRFFVSCMGGASRQEVDTVLETAQCPVEGLLSEDATGLVGNIKTLVLPNGDLEALSSFLFNERKDFMRPEIHGILQQLEFDLIGKSVRWLGWREEGGQLVRVTNTKKRKVNYALDENGRPITVAKPTRMRYAGVHSISNGLTYNLISRTSEATEASGRIMAVAEVTGNSLGGDNAYFSSASEKHITNCIALHRMVEGPNGRECSVNDVQKFTTNEKELRWYVDKLKGVIREKQRLGESFHAMLLLKNLLDYFEGEWLRLDQKTKGNIQSCVTNLFGDITRNAQLLKTFCEPSKFSFRDCLNKGKVYTLVLTAYPNAQKLIGTCMKLDFQQEVLKRTQAAQVNKKRFLVFLADEYQFFITTSGSTKSGGDDTFLSIARQSRIFNLICTQALSSLLAVQKDENKINAFMQCFGSRFFLANLDDKTNKLAELSFGQVFREKTSYNGPDLKLSSMVDGGKGGSTTRNTEKQNRYEASVFTQLDGFEAIIFNKGRPGNKKSVRANLLKEAVFLNGAEVVACTNNYYQAYIENRAEELGIGFLFNHRDSVTEDQNPAEKAARQKNLLRSWREGKMLAIHLMQGLPEAGAAGAAARSPAPSETPAPGDLPMPEGPDVPANASPEENESDSQTEVTRPLEQFIKDCGEEIMSDASKIIAAYSQYTNPDAVFSDITAGQNTDQQFSAEAAEVTLPAPTPTAVPEMPKVAGEEAVNEVTQLMEDIKPTPVQAVVKPTALNHFLANMRDVPDDIKQP